MKAALFMFFLAGSLGSELPASAQDPAAPSAASASDAGLSPDQVAAYQRRFEAGYALEQQGELEQARTVFDGILAEQPDAKRSLLEAGRISLQLNEPLKADAYLDRLHTLVPEFPDATELLIQANQAMRHDVKVERLVREFRAMRDSGKVPGFSDSLFFDRENIRLDGGAQIILSQFFDYTKPPYYAIKAELLNAAHETQRVLILKYDPEGTQAVRAKDPKVAHDNVFIVAELFFAGDQMNRIDVYEELLSTPDYEKARTIMLGIFSHTPKAILSTPISAPTQ